MSLDPNVDLTAIYVVVVVVIVVVVFNFISGTKTYQNFARVLSFSW